LGIKVLLDVVDLLVNAFGNEEISAIDEILDKALSESVHVGYCEVLSRLATIVVEALTVVLKTPAAVDSSDSVQMRSGMRWACDAT
jgi:hypothetical protein